MFEHLIGIPFLDGGRTKEGLDCWGAVILVFKEYGIELPDYKIACMDFSKIDAKIEEQKSKWIKIYPPVVPSLVVIKFNEVIFCNHTGVYIGGGKFIHTREKVGVNIDRIESPAWRRKIEGFYIPKGVSYYDNIDNIK